MNHGSQPGSARRGTVACPKCDLCGRVLSVSGQARSALGTAENRVEAELATLQSNLWHRYVRLQRAEEVLSRRVRRRSRGGSTAIRQLELERRRLGRELHTGAGQVLAAIRLQLEIIASRQLDPPAPVGQALDRISTLAGEALEQVRSISHRLHPPDWQRLTLAQALEQLWELSGVPQRYESSLRLDPLPREPDLEIKVLLYRAAQEALSNLTRHARATRVEMAMETFGDGVALRIQDNGVGFDAAGLSSAPAGLASGIGLRSIREQAASLGGKLRMESGPNGTRLEVLAPFSPVDP